MNIFKFALIFVLFVIAVILETFLYVVFVCSLIGWYFLIVIVINKDMYSLSKSIIDKI
ncbi:MAG: hypothetical protein GY679_01245 [Mycoplasma sp.]|nr:hypothetical protein [Mycoplasma sp.]